MEKKIKPRIAIIGSRGIPANYGGFETFAEEIAHHLHDIHQYDITVVCDDAQRKHNNSINNYKNINLLYSQFSKGKNAIRYYKDSISIVAKDHDIIYSCGPAGGVFSYIAHKHNSILMTNPDGLNGKRSKWNKAVQIAFRSFEFLSCRFSDWVICDSVEIEKYIKSSYGCKTTFVAEYGAYKNAYLTNDDLNNSVLSNYGVTKYQYHLVVSRLEPENNVEDIIRGYIKQKRKYPLLVVGNLNETDFVKKLQEISNDDVIFAGGIYDTKKLSIVRAKTLTYLHGHSVGGTNPSLLEAMGSENLCICHDNPFNKEVVQDAGVYFSDYIDVDKHLSEIEETPDSFTSKRKAALARVENYYNWENIADKYNNIFISVLAKQSK